MSVTRAQVRAIAALARLRLTDEEIEVYSAQLTDILSHVEALEAAEADAAAAGDEPAVPGRLRPDTPPADPLHRQPSDFAPAWDRGFFTVPRLAAMDGDAEPEPS